MYVCLTCWLITNQLSFVGDTKKSAVAKQSQGDEEDKGEKENHERSYLSLLQALCSLLNSPQLTRVFTDNSDLNSFKRNQLCLQLLNCLIRSSNNSFLLTQKSKQVSSSLSTEQY
ncbi:hypothetical protein P9112_003442 [Eukaryota sp. TZLM1-RC]